jgi:tRNA(Ile)-lysidine synthase
VLRYRFFSRLLSEGPALTALATGHHLDDQTETVIMRVLRGTGLDGLTGIRSREGMIIRPLLKVRRAAILGFLQDIEQPYRQDASNTVGDATRTRVRRELLPLARSIFGQATDVAPARLAELAADESRFLAAEATRVGRELVDQAGLRIADLLALDPVLARRVLRDFLTCPLASAGTSPECGAAVDREREPTPLAQRLERRHIVDLLTWLRRGQSGQSFDLPGGVRALWEFDHLRLEVTNQPDVSVSSAESFRILVAPAPWPPAAETEGSEVASPPRPRQTAEGWEVTVPATALKGAIRVRNWRPGDRIEPFGLNGHKKVGDLLSERRVPRSQRSRTLVVEDAAGILWVPGVAQAERTRLTPSAERAVTIQIVPRSRSTSPSPESEVR